MPRARDDGISNDAFMLNEESAFRGTVASIETRRSWIMTFAALWVMSVGFGAPYLAVVALKPMAADLGERAVPSLAYSLAWLGMAVGGIGMGHIAVRFGTRWTVMFGSAMVSVGLVLASRGRSWEISVGYGVFIGLLGIAAMNAPLYVYVSHWFDRRLGTALALVSSGQYVAGTIWPAIFERAIAQVGWHQTMVLFGAAELVLVAPVALMLRSPPEFTGGAIGTRREQVSASVPGLRPNAVLALIATASFFCCVPMAMPQGHLVAFCSDLGIAPAHGAAMLSVLLGAAFLSRQVWGWISDRIGGLRTVLACSACQAAAIAALLFTQDEIGLFTVSVFFGFGFSGLIPSYVLAIRELFPASEASWRVPIFLLFSGSGMAFGGWAAGVIYDYFGFYEAAFAFGVMANIVNLSIIGFLVFRLRGRTTAPALLADGIRLDF